MLRRAAEVYQGLIERFAYERKGRHAVCDVLDGNIHRIAPGLDRDEGFIASGHFSVQRDVAEFAFALHPFEQGRVTGNLHAARLDFLADPQQIKRANDGVKSVAATGFGVEVYKGPHFASVFADRLQRVVLDEHRGETFLMFDFHGIKHAAIRINADEEFLGRREFA